MKIFLMETNAARQLLFVQGSLAKAEINPVVGGMDINAEFNPDDLKRYFKEASDDGALNSFDDMPGTECRYEDILEQCQADHDAATLTLLYDEDGE